MKIKEHYLEYMYDAENPVLKKVKLVCETCSYSEEQVCEVHDSFGFGNKCPNCDEESLNELNEDIQRESLLAAAPDLLEALARAIELYEDGDPSDLDVMAWLASAQAALNKARGFCEKT